MDVTLKNLPGYLEKIHTFLNNDDKSYVFPSLTMAVEDVLVNIAKDPNYLKKFDDEECRSWARPILAVLEENNQIYTLSCGFENCVLGNKVMVYKKIPIHKNTKIPVPIFKEPLGLKQLRKPHLPTTQPAPCKDSTNTNTVMSSFKANVLNATLKFVKNEKQLVLQYQDVSTEQADFIKHMITQCLTSKDCSTTPGGRGMFDPLAEALRIYSKKYHFKLNKSVPVNVEMKRLFFEKIPKKIKEEKDFDTLSISSISSEDSLENHNIKHLIHNLDNNFIRNAIIEIKEFLLKDDERIEFKNVSIPQEQFLTQWKSVLISSEVIKLFDDDIQDVLRKIRKILMEYKGVFRIRTTMQIVSQNQRTVFLKRKWAKYIRDQKVPMQVNPEDKLMPSKSTPLRKIKTENDITEKNTTTNLIPMTKMTVNSLPTIKVKIENDVNDMTVNSKMAIETDKTSANITEKPKTDTGLKRIIMHSSNENTPLNNVKSKVPEVNNNATVNSSMAKVNNATVNSSMAKVNNDATVNSSMAKVNASANSLPIDKLNDGDDFIVARTSQMKSSSTKKSKKLLALQTSLTIVNGKFVENAITELRDFIISSKETINFTNLTKDEQEIILHWEDLINRNEIVCMFCVRGQMLLDEIRTYLDNSRGKFTVAISSKTCSPINRTVTFTRTLKKKPNTKTGTKTVAEEIYPELFDHVISLSNCNTSTSQVSLDKEIEKFFNKTNLISEKWIKTALKQLKNFIQDDAQASLVIPDVNTSQVAFLCKWQTILSLKEVTETYNSDVKVLLTDIRESMAQKMSWLRVTCCAAKSKKDNSREMTFSKIPYFGNKSPEVPTKTAPKVNTNKVEIPPKSNPSKAEIASKTVEPVKKIAVQGIPKSSSVTSLPVAKVPVVSDRGRPKSATVPSLPQAKAKLIEALSQPLVSERGLKMMRNMGWDGGALGLRGEGIVEPIALPLDLKKGAGLGCVKESKQSKHPLKNLPVMTNLPVNTSRVVLPYSPSKADLKKGFLQTIHTMVLNTSPATEVVFPKQLTDKNWSFVKNSVISLNERTKYFVDQPALRELSQKIMEKLTQSQCIITACWGASKANVLFVLSKSIYQPLDLDHKDWYAIVNFEKSKEPELNMSVNNADSVIVAGETFRYYVLAQILEFCERSNITIDKVPAKLTKEVVLKGSMLPKQMSYIKDVINRLNNRSRPSTDSKNEKAVFTDVIGVMKGFTLDVDFPMYICDDENKPPDYKIIRFHKIFDAQRTTKLNKPTHTAKINTKSDQEDKINTKSDQEDKINTKSDQEDKINTKSDQVDKINTKSDQEDKINTKSYQEDKINTESEKKDTKRRTTFTSDTFDEKNMFESQITPIDDQSAPKQDLNKPTCDQNAPIDKKNDKKDTKRRTTFTCDIFDEKCMFESQITPIDDQNAPMVVQDAPKNEQASLKHDQNAPKLVQNELKHDQNAPKIAQDVPIVGHAEKSSTAKTLPNLIEDVDCICCLENVEIDKENHEKEVEYIFLQKETVESDIGRSIVTVTKDEKGSDTERDKTIENLDEDIQNLSIKEKMDVQNAEVGHSEEISSVVELEIQNSNYQEKDVCKRPISNPSTPDRSFKKVRYEKFFKKVKITPKNYPQSEITNEIAEEIQKSILESIDYTEELPLLQCHGIQDGALVYSCHTDKSLNFLINVIKIKSLDLVTMSQESEHVCYKMTVRIRSFVKESVEAIFDRLETYNMNLDTKNWKVIDIERGSDFVIISIDVDEDSYNMIYREKFTLYTGIDQAKFSILWCY